MLTTTTASSQLSPRDDKTRSAICGCRMEPGSMLVTEIALYRNTYTCCCYSPRIYLGRVSFSSGEHSVMGGWFIGLFVRGLINGEQFFLRRNFMGLIEWYIEYKIIVKFVLEIGNFWWMEYWIKLQLSSRFWSKYWLIKISTSTNRDN